MIRIVITLLIAILFFCPNQVSASPVLGGQIFSDGGNVEIEVLPAEAGGTSKLYLFSPGPARFIATNRDIGKVVSLGSFPIGTELIFGIVTESGQTFYLGPASRNPDQILHAFVDFIAIGKANVGFEDLFGGGDRDYNDNMFQFRGGIAGTPPPVFSNVRVIATISTTNIDLDTHSISKQPTNVTIDSINNITIIEWQFPSFSIGQLEDISVDAMLKNPIQGESRLITYKVELLYNDINGNPVRTELVPQYVKVLNSAFDSSISCDKSTYKDNENIVISLKMTNLSEYARIINAKVLIEDGQGLLVKEVATLAGLSFAPGETRSLNTLIFNTGTLAAGNYKARLILYENQKQVGEAFASFAIQPALTLNSRVTTDKIAYNPNEQAAISSIVTNTSPNYIFENLKVKITISGAGGQIVFPVTKAIPTLMPGQIFEFKTYWNTANNAPGSYSANLTLTSAAGEVLSTSQTAFEILSTSQTGSGLKGSISASPSQVYQGREESLIYNVANSGNADLQNINLKVLIVDPGTQETKLEVMSQKSEVRRGIPITETLSASTVNLAPKTYLAVLQAKVGGNAKTLASATFEVLPGLEIKQTIPDYGRVLVWINDGCEKDGDEGSGVREREEKDNKDKDEDKEDGKGCIRHGLIENALKEIGVAYHIVKYRRDFQKELRSNYYTDYLILGDRNPLEDHYGEELRERVHSGKGLITSPWIVEDEDNELFGIKIKGTLKARDNPVEFIESEVFHNQTFQSYGKAAKVKGYNEQNVLAWINKKSQKSGVKSQESEERKETNKYPAIIKNEYGNGKALFFAFDPGLSARIENYSQFVEILKASLSYIHKPQETQGFYPYDIVPVRTEIKSLGGVFDLKGTGTYPNEIRLIDASTGLLITENPWMKEIRLNANETKTMGLFAITPDAIGRYPLTIDVSYLEGGAYKPYQTLSTEIKVEKDSYALINDIIYRLSIAKTALSDGSESEKVEEAIRYIEGVRGRVIYTKDDLEYNIRDLLKAVDAVRAVKSAYMETRLDMDRLLGIYNGRWYMWQ